MGISDHSEYDVVRYSYFKLIQDMNLETSSTLVSFGGNNGGKWNMMGITLGLLFGGLALS